MVNWRVKKFQTFQQQPQQQQQQQQPYDEADSSYRYHDMNLQEDYQ